MLSVRTINICILYISKIKNVLFIILYAFLSWPVYGGLSTANSITVAGSFVLPLKQPMPVCLSLVSGITSATGVDCADVSSPHPLLKLIAQVSSGGKAETLSSKGLFVVSIVSAIRYICIGNLIFVWYNNIGNIFDFIEWCVSCSNVFYSTNKIDKLIY